MTAQYLPEFPEPPTGSVVAIDWNGPHQEVWVSNRSNIGNWYTPDAMVSGHPTWQDVVLRAKAIGHGLVLLVAADADTYRTAWQTAAQRILDDVSSFIEERVYSDPIPTSSEE